MARRSARQSLASSTKSPGSIEPSSSKKRTALPAQDGRQRPAKQRKVTPQFTVKSQYFEHDNDIDDNAGSSEHDESTDESDFDVVDPSDEPDDDDDSDEEDAYSSEDDKPRRKGKSILAAKGKRSSLPAKATNHDLEREGSSIGMEPGTEIITKKPKARSAGKTPFADDTVHPNTMLFLKELKANNDREWLKSKSKSTSADLLHVNLEGRQTMDVAKAGQSG